VEGGSCNDYDYVCGDPINGFDIDGTCAWDACVVETVVLTAGAVYVFCKIFCDKPQAYVTPPKQLPGFPNAHPVPGKTRFPGGIRRRWKDSDGQIFEWDYQHGRVEKYDKRGRHLGEFDHKTGRQIKPADPKRRIEP